MEVAETVRYNDSHHLLGRRCGFEDDGHCQVVVVVENNRQLKCGKMCSANSVLCMTVFVFGCGVNEMVEVEVAMVVEAVREVTEKGATYIPLSNRST